MPCGTSRSCDHFLQALAVLGVGDLAGDAAAARGVGHQHRIAAGERQIGGERRALVAALFLDHLHQQDLAALDDFLDLVVAAHRLAAVAHFLERILGADQFDLLVVEARGMDFLDHAAAIVFRDGRLGYLFRNDIGLDRRCDRCRTFAFRLLIILRFLVTGFHPGWMDFIRGVTVVGGVIVRGMLLERLLFGGMLLTGLF